MTRSSRLVLKFVSANSPVLSPRPAKSKRSTASPRSARRRLIQLTALNSLEQVKQWAKIAAEATGRFGRSRRAEMRWPARFAKLTRSVLGCMMVSPLPASPTGMAGAWLAQAQRPRAARIARGRELLWRPDNSRDGGAPANGYHQQHGAGSYQTSS